MQLVPPAERARDPLLAAGLEYARRFGRDPALPPALMAWTDPLFPGEAGEARRLREAACWMSDIGSHDHPEYRAEQAFLRILRQPGIGLDHHARAFLGLTLALRYEAEPEAPFLATARHAAERGGDAAGDHPRGGDAAGLHALGRHAGPAGGHAAAGQPCADAASGGGQRRVRRRERDPAAGTAGAGDGAGGDDRGCGPAQGVPAPRAGLEAGQASLRSGASISRMRLPSTPSAMRPCLSAWASAPNTSWRQPCSTGRSGASSAARRSMSSLEATSLGATWCCSHLAASRTFSSETRAGEGRGPSRVFERRAAGLPRAGRGPRRSRRAGWRRCAPRRSRG